jgi:DNA polymerase IV
MPHRKIIHLDMDAFFCAVEALHAPTLRGKAFAVGGRPEHRGVIASCSYPARRYGIHSAMPTSQALQRCPDLILISNHRSDYSAYSQRVMAHLENLTDTIEQLSIDEAFIDVSDLKAPAATIAADLQQAIWQDLHLPCSLGVATNKLVAKIANNIGKASSQGVGPPMAINVIPPGEEQAFLAPLPVTELWGVGPKTAEHLYGLGVRTIGDLAAWSQDDLVQRFGEHGASLARRARGEDARPVMSDRAVKSVSHETTFDEDVTDETELKRTLCLLSEGVGRRLRRAELTAATIKIKLRWSDFETLTRQVTLEAATDQDSVIYATAQQLLTAHWPVGKPVRLIGVGASNLTEPIAQLRLWDTSAEKSAKLQETLDHLRDRFGREAIRRAITLDPDNKS